MEIVHVSIWVVDLGWSYF